VVVGYEVRVSNDLIVLADVVREQELEEDREINLLEAGARYRLTPFSVLSAGVGFGVGDESPDVRTTVGFQVQF
jgi:hypothetical protein